MDPSQGRGQTRIRIIFFIKHLRKKENCSKSSSKKSLHGGLSSELRKETTQGLHARWREHSLPLWFSWTLVSFSLSFLPSLAASSPPPPPLGNRYIKLLTLSPCQSFLSAVLLPCMDPNQSARQPHLTDGLSQPTDRELLLYNSRTPQRGLPVLSNIVPPELTLP